MRQGKSVRFPSAFMLIVALNPCPCGYYGDIEKACRCTEYDLLRYWRKLSAPLLDRFDIFVELPRICTEQLQQASASESSRDIQERVTQARQRQLKRFHQQDFFCNGRLNNKLLNQFCLLDKSSQTFIDRAVKHLDLSPRSYHRLLKVSRTIADLEQSESIEVQHVAEAVQFRNAFDKYF